MNTHLLKGLNDRQKEAVEHIDGPLLINAGPGSGKTRVITHRIAYLVRTVGVSPYRIAAVTFTNKATKEMRQRLDNLMGEGGQEVTAGTFHSFCARFLRREGAHLGLSNDYVIYDDADQVSLIKRSMEETNVDPKRFSPRAIQYSISAAKSQLLTPDDFTADNYFDEIVHRVYERYEHLMGQSSAVDFDDLLLKAQLILEKVPEVAARYQDRYVHFMIDEFQDTDVVQYALARKLSEHYRNLCVVGDPDQSIYSWRNADIRNILSFQKDYPEAKVIALEENYRSTKTILEAAQSLIAPNEQRVEKELFTSNGSGVPIVVSEGYNEREEAQMVVREISNLVGSGDYELNDVAVMYRVNAQSRALEEACLRHGMPYQLVGSIRFYQRQEIKDVAAYLRLIANPDDDVAFGRVVNTPTRGIGQRTLDDLMRYARDTGTSLFTAAGGVADGAVPLAARSARALTRFTEMIEALVAAAEDLDLVELIDLLLDRTGYKGHVQDEAERGEERWENIQEFRNTAHDFIGLQTSEALMAFLESISLVSDVDNLNETVDAPTLITLHQAKGLEFPVVFIVGMEEGMLPHSRSLEDPSEMEEERRLAYVGVTRAKERLYLMRAFRRGFRGMTGPSKPSRFLNDVPRWLIVSPGAWGDDVDPDPEPDLDDVAPSPTRAFTRSRRRTSSITQSPVTTGPVKTAESLDTLSTGDKVRHSTFGDGIVTDSKPTVGDVEVTVAFKDGMGVKRLLQSMAKLEKVPGTPN